MGTGAVAREVEQRLEALEGVLAAEVNAVVGRVAVDHDPAQASPAALACVVADADPDTLVAQPVRVSAAMIAEVVPDVVDFEVAVPRLMPGVS